MDLPCAKSMSPCEYEISHHTPANTDHVLMKLIANTSIVQRHCASTKVVKMS